MSRPSVERTVARCLADSELAGRDITVALSGGLDSVVLLHALAGAAADGAIALSALHVHHGLHPDAQQWTDHCAALCAAWRIPLEVVRVSVDRRDPRGIESAARAARYAAYERARTDAVALGHHADDQAETVLLQLLRGAGSPGIAAMPALRRLRSGAWLMRPLLPLPRAELRRYAQDRGLAWVEDGSNAEDRFRRNALRARVMPALEAHFPGYRRTLARAAANAADAAQLADALGELDLARCAAGEGLSVDALRALDAPRRVNAVRVWLHGRGLEAPPRDALLEGLGQMLGATDNAQPELRFGRHRLRRYRDVLRVTEAAMPGAGGWRVRWRGETRLVLPDGRQWCAEPATGAGVRAVALEAGLVELTPRAGGERLRIAPNRPRRTLKNLAQEAGLPPWERERLVVVRLDGVPVHVPGLGTDPAHAAGEGEAGWVFRAADGGVPGA